MFVDECYGVRWSDAREAREASTIDMVGMLRSRATTRRDVA